MKELSPTNADGTNYFNPCNYVFYYSHFTDEKTETQRGTVIDWSYQLLGGDVEIKDKSF